MLAAVQGGPACSEDISWHCQCPHPYRQVSSYKTDVSRKVTLKLSYKRVAGHHQLKHRIMPARTIVKQVGTRGIQLLLTANARSVQTYIQNV